MKRRFMDYKGPYGKCVYCTSIQLNCDGPRTSTIETIEEWCDLMRAFKERWGYTNEYIAEQSKVSLTTVTKIMAGNVEKDIRWNTVKAIENVLLGRGGKQPCPTIDQDPDAQFKQIEMILSGIHDSYREEIVKVRADAAREVELYKDKIAILETQIADLKTLVITRGRMMEKLIDKS